MRRRFPFPVFDTYSRGVQVLTRRSIGVDLGRPPVGMSWLAYAPTVADCHTVPVADLRIGQRIVLLSGVWVVTRIEDPRPYPAAGSGWYTAKRMPDARIVDILRPGRPTTEAIRMTLGGAVLALVD
jgi:hypothetical protein